MVKEETWGLPLERVEGFFRAQPDVTAQDQGYAFLSCRITLKALEPGLLGKFPFPRTGLQIAGPEEEVKIIQQRFLMQFLSAGG